MLVGLGNPGQEYAQTKHNAGFWLADNFSSANQCGLVSKVKFSAQTGQVEINGDTWIVLKPTTFMNRSGFAVRMASQYFNVLTKNILVAHDELDFEPGIIRFKRGGGHGGHNGLRDIIAQLGEADFARLRIGIGRSGNMATYVLKPPGKHQRLEIDNVITKAMPILPDLLGVSAQQAIQQLHAV